ncbi:MAG: homoserine kinase [Alphaproteobacteria bacterium]|nr:homoserine kinase [Alphaproteobacteria bacterium]
MAVYTQVDDDALSAFVGEYAVGKLTACKGIAEGVENTNYLIGTSKGRYFLTLYEKRVAPEDLPFFLGLMEHLARRGIACPTPIHGRDGRALRELAGRPAAMVTFIDGLSVMRPTQRHCAHLGEALAALHLAGRDFSIQRKNALGLEGWRRLEKACRRKADTVERGLADEIRRELDDLARHWPDDLPAGVIHADLFPDNVLFLGDKVSGLIDFYFACNDLIAYDVAICLNAWCFEPDGSLNTTKARAYLAGYLKKRKMGPDERAALPILARGAALRFLMTRLYDWLHPAPGALVRPKDPREYLKRLRFHRGVKGIGAYGLE